MTMKWLTSHKTQKMEQMASRCWARHSGLCMQTAYSDTMQAVMAAVVGSVIFCGERLGETAAANRVGMLSPLLTQPTTVVHTPQNAPIGSSRGDESPSNRSVFMESTK